MCTVTRGLQEEHLYRKEVLKVAHCQLRGSWGSCVLNFKTLLVILTGPRFASDRLSCLREAVNSHKTFHSEKAHLMIK
ncbi:Dna Mismatch Repair Protein Msh2 [Manis pentadactyla]|nr:Dna Mismatch Repair Protein Msh2 [Manis pentadactyla]